jgi:hypothetical protein
MKRFAISVFLLCAFFCSQHVFGQDAPVVCKFNMVGTWQLTTEGHANATMLRFNPDNKVSVLSPNIQGGGWQTTDWSTYSLDDPKTPKTLRLAPVIKPGETVDPERVQTINITQADDGAFTSVVTSNAGEEFTQWKRLDPYKYYVILAAAKGTPGYGAPAFATLVKTDGRESQTESFGLYETDPVHHYVEVGPISEEIRKKFGTEPKDDSAVLLRLEVSAGPYERAMKIMQTWERRARENTLLYIDIPYLNNAVYLNQLASSLNDCSQTIKLEKLTWRIDDPIITKQNLPQVPYFFIKDIRQRNEALHVKDSKFHEAWQAVAVPPSK